MIRSRALAAGLVLLAAGAFPLLASGAEIMYALGDVQVSRAGAVEEGFIGYVLDRGDVVTTGPDGTAVIALDDGTELKLRESTSLALDSLELDIAVSLNTGGLFSRVTRKVTGSFRVQTQSAVAGVRGTEFFVAFGRTIDAQPDVWLCVNEGSVDVTIPQTGQNVVVNEGEGISIVGGLKLTKPRFYPWTQRLNWNFDPAGGDVKDTTSLDQAYNDLLDQDYD